MDEIEVEILGLLLKLQILRECETHEGAYFEGREEIREAYRVINARITNGELVLPRGWNGRDATDVAQRLYKSLGGASVCPHCLKNRLRDD